MNQNEASQSYSLAVNDICLNPLHLRKLLCLVLTRMDTDFIVEKHFLHFFVLNPGEHF